jgi:hypothetical protein
LACPVVGDRADDVFQRHADQMRKATPAEIFTAVQTDQLFRDDSLRIADHHPADGNTTYVYNERLAAPRARDARPHPALRLTACLLK